MDAEQRNTVNRALCEVIGTFSFLLLEPKDPSSLTNATVDGWHGRMEYGGARNGETHMWIDLALAKELAGNLLGEDIGGSDKQAASDAVQELLHVVGGHTLNLIHGPDQAIELYPPTVERRAVNPLEGFPPDSAEVFAFQDEQGALILLTLVERGEE